MIDVCRSGTSREKRNSLKNSLCDELEPCIAAATDTQSFLALANCNGSIQSRETTDSDIDNDKVGNCIIICLILFIFLFGTILAFLIGHHIARNRTNETIIQEEEVEGEPTNTFSLSAIKESAAKLMAYNNRSTDQHESQKNETNEKATYFVSDVYPPPSENPMRDRFRKRSRSGEAIPFVSLPKNIVPRHYDLQLDFTNFSYGEQISGNATILLESLDEFWSRYIVFHASANIFIQEIKLYHGGKLVKIRRVQRDSLRKTVRIVLQETLKRDWYAVSIQFTTHICDQELDGIICFRSVSDQNIDRLARSPILGFTTKFGPNAARAFLPCWDEPIFKSTYDITIVHQKGYTVLANTALFERSEQEHPMMLKTKFLRTPSMPTYLIGFVIGLFTPLVSPISKTSLISLWTNSKNHSTAQFAAQFTLKTFDRIQKQFEAAYPLTKLDIVAVDSFKVNEVGNWGLIVLPDTTVLHNPFSNGDMNMAVDILAEQYNIKKLIAHEIIHQWFGSLVTANDWSEIWLNEAFAAFYVNYFLKEEHSLLTSNENRFNIIRILSKQATNEKFAVVRKMNLETDVEEIFYQTYEYNKGYIIVNLIRNLISSENFHHGIRRYLKRNAYKSATRKELWESLPFYVIRGSETEILSKVIEPWLINDGIPEVVINRGYKDGSMRITQRVSDQNRYLLFLNDYISNYHSYAEYPSRRYMNEQFDAPEVMASTSYNITAFNDMLPRITENVNIPPWSIPFSYAVLSAGDTVVKLEQLWLHNESITIILKPFSSHEPLLANLDWKYPFRVNYDISNWKYLADLLHENVTMVPMESRMQLIVDAEFYLLYSGLPEIYLYLLAYLSNETDVGVLLIGLDAVYRLVDTFRATKINKLILIYIRKIIDQIDKTLYESRTNTELAAVWLIDPTKLSQLYQLRCATGLPTCDTSDQVSKWSLNNGLSDGDPYQQMTAVCHWLFIESGVRELTILMNGLETMNSKWSAELQLATCVQNEEVLKLVVNQIVFKKNAALYTAVLQNECSLHYNAMFRLLLWREFGKLSLSEKKLLFSIEAKAASEVSKILIHSVRSMKELEELIKIIPNWDRSISTHLEYVRRKLSWMMIIAEPRLERFIRDRIR